VLTKSGGILHGVGGIQGERAVKPAQLFTARIVQRWPIVVALAVIGGLVAAYWSITNATTVWTATTALTTQSQNRSPDQDAVLALGYVNYFNQDSYQHLLRDAAAIPPSVTLQAKTGATSPVFYISASGPSRTEVRDAAVAAAAGYRADVRKSLVAERQQAAADLQAEIDRNVVTLVAPGRTDAEKSVIRDQIRSLQGRLTDLQADNTNLVKQLQPEPGLASSTPSPAADVAAGAVGGAVLGIMVAILLGTLDTRVRTERDVAQRLGLVTLAEFDRRADASARTRRLANLANGLRLGGAEAGNTVVAVVSARRSARPSSLAEELVAFLAARRTSALLLRTDLASQPDRSVVGRTGLVEVLAGQVGLRSTILRHPGGWDVLPAGQPPAGESFAAFTPQRVAAVMNQLSACYEVVVVDVPPVLDASESQLICAEADLVIIVADRGRTRVHDVREAVSLLTDVAAPLSGVVIDSQAAGRSPVTAGQVAAPGGEHVPEPRTNGKIAGLSDVAAADRSSGSRPVPADGEMHPSPSPRMPAHSTGTDLFDHGRAE
jgi:Mrp family chromosome partitioning ATPase